MPRPSNEWDIAGPGTQVRSDQKWALRVMDEAFGRTSNAEMGRLGFAIKTILGPGHDIEIWFPSGSADRQRGDSQCVRPPRTAAGQAVLGLGATTTTNNGTDAGRGTVGATRQMEIWPLTLSAGVRAVSPSLVRFFLGS